MTSRSTRRVPTATTVGGPVRDRGAALVMAIVFVVLIGTVAGGLAAFIASSVGQRIPVTAERDRQYALAGAVDEAIAHHRASRRAGLGDPDRRCGTGPGGSHRTVLNEVEVRVDCRLDVTVGLGPTGRPEARQALELWACVDTGRACTGTDRGLRALVDLGMDDEGNVASTAVRSWSVTG